MPQITISYQNQKTLEALQDFAKYLDFVIEKPKNSIKKNISTKVESVIVGDSTIDTSELTKIFSKKNIDAKKLRNDVWQRK